MGGTDAKNNSANILTALFTNHDRSKVTLTAINITYNSSDIITA
jgi:hypothetical protein